MKTRCPLELAWGSVRRATCVAAILIALVAWPEPVCAQDLLPLPAPLAPVALPVPAPLERVALPAGEGPATGSVEFGTLEFDPPPPPRPANRSARAAAKAPESTGDVTFGEIEFEAPPKTGDVTFGSLEFEVPPAVEATAAVDRLKSAVQDVLKRQKEAQRRINQSLDELDKKADKKPAPPAKRWHARGIPGGNVEVGILRSRAEAATATYTAPLVIPGDAVVAIQVKPESGPAADELSAAAAVTILDTDAVLEARWRIEERQEVTFSKTEPGPFGPKISQSDDRRTLLGSGTVRFEDRPMQGMTRTQWQEYRATMSGMTGQRWLQAVSADGRYGLAGGGTWFNSSPAGSDRSDTTLSAQTLSPQFAASNGVSGITLKTDGKTWVITEWNVDEWRPKIRITVDGRHRSERKDEPPQSWTTSNVEPTSTVEVYTPLAKPDHAPAPSVTASRHGSLTLRPAGEGRFSGYLQFHYRSATPEDGVSTNVTVRTVTWQFELQLSEPGASP